MSQLSDLSSILNNSLLLSSYIKESIDSSKLQQIQKDVQEIPSILDKETITKLQNGEFGISLKEYTSMSSYNTMMNALYGNNSANKFQNMLNSFVNNSEADFATAKSFVDKMKENGMSEKTAVKTFIALQKYSLMSSVNNYNFVNAKA